MTYLDEAYRRMKLPIDVYVGDGALSKVLGPFIYIEKSGGQYVGGGYNPAFATMVYLTAVKELQAVNELGGL